MLKRFLVPVSSRNKDYDLFVLEYPFFYRHKILLPLLPFYRIFRAIKAGRFQEEAKAIGKARK